MSDIGPYGVTQNADAVAVVADALVGERAGNVTAHQAGAGYGPASFSTAPYIPPATTPKPLVEQRLRDGRPLCIAKDDTCRGWAVDDTDFCRWHQP